jgi:hypothetical protein
MNSGTQSVVTVMSDYVGPLEPFAVVVAVPDDVTMERVGSIRREFVDRIDQISAPRYHEFWEMDPCDPGQVQQEWERDLRVSTSGDNFLGANMDLGPTRKVPKELLLNVKTEEKNGEYTFFMPEAEQTFVDLVRARGWVLSAAMEQAITTYTSSGSRFVLAEVDPKRIELVGGERAQLSPIRFWSDRPYTRLPSKLGRLAASGAQELFLFVLDHQKRFSTTNYEVGSPPTNIEVDYEFKEEEKTVYLKERMAELFAGLHDTWLARHPRTFWLEYAWKADGCGEPCPNDPILINELLTLGGEIFERGVSDEEKNPKPPPMTDEEKNKAKLELEGLMPKERPKHKKMLEEERRELAVRRALLERHHYVITRLHHRYSDDGLPNDVEFGPVEGGLEGGIWLPKGEKKELSQEVKPADANRLQTRFVNFHPWKGMQACETPERYRWGKPPRTYRGLRKIWVVEDLARKSRTEVNPAYVIQSPIPSLGLVRQTPKPAGDGGLDGGVGDGEKSKGCGCRVADQETGHQSSRLFLGLLALVGTLLGRRATRRHGRR